MGFRSGLGVLLGVLAWEASAWAAPVPLPVGSGAPELLAQSAALETSDPEQALELAQAARERAGDERGRLTADLRIASLNRLLSRYVTAAEQAQKGLAQATQLNDVRLMAGFRNVLARTQWNIGNYQASLELYLTVLREAAALEDQAMAFDAHCGISSVFGDFNQPEQAFFHLEQARQIGERLGDQVRLGDYHKILGNNAHRRRDYAVALEEHERSRRIHADAGSERGVADALQNLGFTNEQLGKLELAHQQTQESIAIYRRLGLRRHLINALRQSGRLLVKLKRVDEGVKELEEALALTQQIKSLSLSAYAYRELARAYEAQGNLNAAYQAQQKLVTSNEAVFNERSSQQLAILNSRYIEERRQLEIDLLRRDQALKDAALARSQAERHWLLVVAGVSVVALGAIVWGLRMKLKAERRIVTESRAARVAAEQADQLKTRLLGIVSHDLKSPLAALMGGFAHLREVAPHEREFLDDLSREGERMMDLIRDLLDHAALEAGQLRISRVRLDVTALAVEVVAIQQARARSKGLTLSLDGAAKPAWAKGDWHRLRQVFVNLVDNALKFTPGGGRVVVRVGAGPAEVILAVSDTGPGLTPRDLDNLFKPFTTLSSQPTAGESSSGLGLSICQELVALHQGRITVQSEVGRGTTFTVHLPADGTPAGPGSRAPI